MGTIVLLVVLERYSAVIPSRISPVDSVTISGLSSSTATSETVDEPDQDADHQTTRIASEGSS